MVIGSPLCVWACVVAKMAANNPTVSVTNQQYTPTIPQFSLDCLDETMKAQVLRLDTPNKLVVDERRDDDTTSQITNAPLTNGNSLMKINLMLPL